MMTVSNLLREGKVEKEAIGLIEGVTLGVAN